MCWKLVDDNSGEIICRSTIRSIIELGAANLQVDPLEPIPKPVDNAPTNDILDNFMSLADFETPLYHTTMPGPVDSIPASTKSQVCQEIVRGIEITKTLNSGISMHLNPRLLSNSIDILLDRSPLAVITLFKLLIMGSLPSLSVSEIQGRQPYLFGNSMNSFFATNLESQDLI